MAYTLKSNATTAAFQFLFVGENGLTNLVSGGGAITATGANMTPSTVGGHTVYGDGASGAAAAQYLAAAAVAAIGAGVKFAVLLVGHPSYDANDDDNYILGPGSTQFGTGVGTVMRSVIAGNTQRGQAATGWNTGLHRTVWGRDSANAIRHYFDGVGSTLATGASAWTVAAGSWSFGGTPNGGTNAGYGVGICGVAIGLGPDELETYIAANGAEAYAALLNSTGPTLTTPTITGVGATTATPGITTDTATGTLYLVNPTVNSAPSAAQVKAGQNAAGAAVPSNSQAVASAGAKTAAMTGLTAGGVTYYPFWVHTNGSGVDSAVTAGTSFTTSAAAATAVTMTGPSSGAVGAASTAFTVGANGTITGTDTVTPSDGGGGGTFTPTSVAISSGTPTATFTYTPASAGAKTISVTNNGGLANPSTITYTASALPYLNFQAAGMELGARTGLGIPTFGLENGKSYRYTVHADGLTLGAALITSAAITLDGAGKFPNLASGSLVTGVTYVVCAMRQSDGAAAIFRMVAQ